MLRTELRTEQEKNKALIEERDADRDRYQRVIAEINSSSPLQLRRRKLDNVASSGQPLDRDDRKVKMSMKYFPPKKVERSVATGKVVGVVDGSAEELAAWVVDFSSNERTRVNMKDFGDKARLELREKARVNEGTFATVKKFPFFLDNKEFVFRQIWKSDEGNVLIACESTDDEVDYGTKLRKTRGFLRAIWQIEDHPVRGGAKQCRVMFIQYLDFGGSIPTWVVDSKMPEALSAV
ncbi:hypothetical protein TrLO_g3052 [Triparma laevis f. longispina]|uniref:START domain-containing protein n=1 Tax=Triparma laevis f. longispina TaxID=1714387 RepID=A0A9W7B100_9STRA|nr:hypothetical protein TrLO_g3052 [Triparma laevis f. longispina]